MRVLFIANIPSPYRINFYQLLGEKCDLTVVFEAKGTTNRQFNYNLEEVSSFDIHFLSDIVANQYFHKVNKKILPYLQEKFDRIVITSYDSATEQYANRYLRRRNIPFYISSDGGFIKEKEFFFKRWYKRFLISGASGYFSSGKKTSEYLEYYGAKEEKIHLYPFTSIFKRQILNSPVTDNEKKDLRKKLGIEEKRVLIGVGQFIERKGWDILLKALPNDRCDIGTYIIGGKEIEEYHKIVIERKISNVHFLPFMSSEMLATYYKASDLFVLPTREDIWGLVINEAMAYGLPVITTDRCIAGLEMIQDNGYIFKSEDIEDLNGKILKIIDNDELKNSFSNKSIEISKNWTIEKMVDKYYLGFKED